jgi:hypothetical protein
VILAQIGWGKGDQVDVGASDGSLAGAVLSPRDEEPVDLASCANRWKKAFKGAHMVMADPQFYVTTIPNARDGKLPSYPYYAPSLSRASFTPTAVRGFAEKVLDFQDSIDVDRWLSPTVLFNSFRDPWSQIALSLAQSSIEVHKSKSKSKGLLVSLVVDEQALRDRPALDEYLDAISTFEVDGFYIIVRRNDPTYPAAYEEDALVNLMYLTHVLSDRNSFEVIHGYTDIVGSLFLAAGAKAICTGWYSNLRQFSLARFLPATGGRPPRARYTSRQLMNSLFVNPEMAQIATAKRMASVLSGTGYDSSIGSNPLGAPWPRRTSCLHHWKVLSAIDAKVTAGKKVTARVSALEELLKVAQATYTELGVAGVTFEPMTGPRDVSLWQRAVSRFKAEIGL